MFVYKHHLGHLFVMQCLIFKEWLVLLGNEKLMQNVKGSKVSDCGIIFSHCPIISSFALVVITLVVFKDFYLFVISPQNMTVGCTKVKDIRDFRNKLLNLKCSCHFLPAIYQRDFSL